MKFRVFATIIILFFSSFAFAKAPFKKADLWISQDFGFYIENLDERFFTAETIYLMQGDSTLNYKYRGERMIENCKVKNGLTTCKYEFKTYMPECVLDENACDDEDYSAEFEDVVLEFSVDLNSVNTFSGNMTLKNGRVLPLTSDNLLSIEIN